MSERKSTVLLDALTSAEEALNVARRQERAALHTTGRDARKALTALASIIVRLVHLTSSYQSGITNLAQQDTAVPDCGEAVKVPAAVLSEQDRQMYLLAADAISDARVAVTDTLRRFNTACDALVDAERSQERTQRTASRKH
jgi:hypothetical protein